VSGSMSLMHTTPSTTPSPSPATSVGLTDTDSGRDALADYDSLKSSGPASDSADALSTCGSVGSSSGHSAHSHGFRFAFVTDGPWDLWSFLATEVCGSPVKWPFLF
jgi:hypothetical protein